jgi:hypothetical protein
MESKAELRRELRNAIARVRRQLNVGGRSSIEGKQSRTIGATVTDELEAELAALQGAHAGVGDEQDDRQERLAPASGVETNPEARESRFDVSSVIRRSANIVRGRWVELLVLTCAFLWAPGAIVAATVPIGYRPGSDDLVGFGLMAAVRVGRELIGNLALTTIMAAALRDQVTSLASSVAKVLLNLPTLVPIWLALGIDTAWRLWTNWIDLAPNPDRLFGVFQTVSEVEMSLALVATATVGVLIPVAIEKGAASRSLWRERGV